MDAHNTTCLTQRVWLLCSPQNEHHLRMAYHLGFLKRAFESRDAQRFCRERG